MPMQFCPKPHHMKSQKCKVCNLAFPLHLNTWQIVWKRGNFWASICEFKLRHFLFIHTRRIRNQAFPVSPNRVMPQNAVLIIITVEVSTLWHLAEAASGIWTLAVWIFGQLKAIPVFFQTRVKPPMLIPVIGFCKWEYRRNEIESLKLEVPGIPT